MIITRAMQRNALRALGIPSDGTIASVVITTTAVVVVRVQGDQSWTEVHYAARDRTPHREEQP
ncbi:hypothetical protein SEA_RIBEYE_65 [Gordonia phage Ribeye]|uniref:Uncharacterized protein n=1 Tax=Gordonia phage Ribeye TaxID=2250417 RepID=A0A345KPH6_9CAUD|nr:hypothetical protein J1768_gp65 [Gordonia phage Ribeye]AXH44928.1 hypothetical protein SEA_RIBEYE_65 [Gordonia phage Ribeye]